MNYIVKTYELIYNLKRSSSDVSLSKRPDLSVSGSVLLMTSSNDSLKYK